MSDERIEWTGHPSKWQNLGWFSLCLLLIPIPLGIWKWLETRSTTYKLSELRLTFTRGIFTKTTEDLELYRVRDTKYEQNLFERMLGLGKIEVFTTDETSPTIKLAYIEGAEAVREKIRALVEARRDAKRVRYLDAE